MIKINTPLEVIPKSLSEASSFIFIHQTSEKFDVLKPLSYKELSSFRSADYILDRKKHEQENYHTKVEGYDKEQSFLYASLASRSKLHASDALLSYPGYVYYFKLTKPQIEKCIFECLGGINYKQKKAQKGMTGLLSAIKEWDENSKSFKRYYDKVVGGYIEPRIEVIIPFEVEYIAYVPQVEDRHFYHGSRQKLSSLRKGSYVTPYKYDASIFAIPWSTSDLIVNDSLSSIKGRPPEMLFLKDDANIDDMPLYIYKVKNIETQEADTNTGESYPWNRVTKEEASLKNKKMELIETIPSWKERFLI